MNREKGGFLWKVGVKSCSKNTWIQPTKRNGAL